MRRRWVRGAARLAAAVVVLGSLAAAAPGTGSASAEEPSGATGPPALAMYANDGRIQVRTRNGGDLASFAPVQFFSLEGNVLARSRLTDTSEVIIASNATNAQQLYRIRNGFAPVVTRGGERIVFAPDRMGHRDPYVTSLWLRTQSGIVRRVFQLTGPHATVPSDPFEGEAIPLSWSVDRPGRMLAVALGNDVTHFEYDVWVVDMKTKDAVRITEGMRSRFPSMSPDGEQVALTREVDECGGPPPGYRATKVQVVSSDGTTRRLLLPGSCASFYTDPRWVSGTQLTAVRLTRVRPAVYVAHLVLVDATTEAVTEVDTGGQISYSDTSAPSGLVTWVRRRDTTGYRLLDVDTGQVREFGAGHVPHLGGNRHLV